MNTIALDNRTKILNLAIDLGRLRGFNAFSYRDLATQVGIKTSSIHYYFPTKTDLGVAMVQSYCQQTEQKLSQIRSSGVSCMEQFRAHVAMFEVGDGKMLCLAGMLATDVETLHPTLKTEIQRFFGITEAWLAGLLQAGKDSGEFYFSGAAAELAKTIVSSLQGALVTARLFDCPGRTVQVAKHLEALFVRIS